MKKIIFTITLLSVQFVKAAESPEYLDGIVAVVGDELILHSELEAYTFMRLGHMQLEPQQVEIESARKEFLSELIDNKILLVKARQDSALAVTNEEVENALNNHIAMLLTQNNLTMKQLEEEIRNQQGLTLAQFRNEMRAAIREQLLKQKIQQSFYFSTSVNRRDVELFYNDYIDSLPLLGESVLLSKISLRITPGEEVRSSAFRKIMEIKNRLDSGEDFADLAISYSEGPEASSGGELGFITKGTITERAFEERAFSLPPNRISEPFETRLGFHIIEVLEKREKGVRLRQIFIRVTPDKEQFNKASSILDSVRIYADTPEKFKKAVSELSVDEVSRSRDGRIGWFTLSELSSDLNSALDTLKTGQITKPVQKNNTVSIYRVDDRVDNRVLSLENDYPFLSEKAKEIAAQKKLIEMVEQWRQDIFIDIRI